MTFSIVATCAATGQFGMAISSSSPAVAARCSHVRAGVGVVASQNITDPELGMLALDAMAIGLTSEQAIAAAADVALEAGFPRIGLINGRQLVDLLIERWSDIPPEFRERLGLKPGLVRT